MRQDEPVVLLTPKTDFANILISSFATYFAKATKVTESFGGHSRRQRDERRGKSYNWLLLSAEIRSFIFYEVKITEKRGIKEA